MANVINGTATGNGGLISTGDKSGIINIQTNETTAVTVDASQNVGIGTTSPGSKLDVKGTLRISGSTSGYVGLAPAAAAGSTTYTLPSADGTNGQLLSTNGSATLSWATVSSSPIPTPDVKTSGSSATWTIPAGVTKVRITVVGGGGSGATNSGGGGAGGTAIKTLSGLTPGNTLTYTVGGTGGTSQVASGTQTITTISATGGSNANGGTGVGGAGGVGSNGDLNIQGQAGAQGDVGGNGTGGTGGTSYLGGGGYGAINGTAGAGGNYGGGGGSTGYTGTNGTGASGVIVFEY